MAGESCEETRWSIRFKEKSQLRRKEKRNVQEHKEGIIVALTNSSEMNDRSSDERIS